jgi:threonine dehydratase
VLSPPPAASIEWGTRLAALPSAERARGIVSYSTGNHAQSLAYASARHGTRCTVVMPAAANPAKAAAFARGAHTLAEGAGAAGLAAVLARPDLCAGKRVAVVCTGGNADTAELATL